MNKEQKRQNKWLVIIIIILLILLGMFLPKSKAQVTRNSYCDSITDHIKINMVDTLTPPPPDTSMVYGVYLYEYGNVEWEKLYQVRSRSSYYGFYYNENTYFDMEWNEADRPIITIENTSYSKIKKYDKTARYKHYKIRAVGSGKQMITIHLGEPIQKTPIYLEDLLEYKQECYNDSTIFHGSLYKMFDGEIIASSRPEPHQMIVGYLRDTTFYMHKPYDDFGDFLNWIERKTK